MDGRGDQEFIVEEGTIVRERQAIIRLPNADSMRVNLTINESLVQYVKPGMAAAIKPVGYGDRVLQGIVEKVNQYAEPTGWRQANVKEYKAFVAIQDPPADLRTGMTAAVTIRCTEIPDALQVPVQTVYAHGDKLYCFVRGQSGWDARPIKPGPTNDKFFVIQSGLNAGDRVAMNPRAHVDDVNLPKLSPEEAQRAVPQPPTVGRRGDVTKGADQKKGGPQREREGSTAESGADTKAAPSAAVPKRTASQGAAE
jgi:hypothetical protein